MSTPMTYHTFRIEVKPSPETNDHEVRFFGDGEDIIASFWNDSLGLDPTDILNDSCQLLSTSKSHRALIARCSCGVIGCGDIEVDVQRSGRFVEWIEVHHRNDSQPRTFTMGVGPKSVGMEVAVGEVFRRSLRFNARLYALEIARAHKDLSWETPDRTAARLLAANVDRHILGSHGFTFQWGSGRLRPGSFGVSLNLDPGPYQIIVNVSWDGREPEAFVGQLVKMLAEPPAIWDDVTWIPQRAGLEAPPIAGRGWHRFRA